MGELLRRRAMMAKGEAALTPIYALPSPLICDGTAGQEIDTGIAVFQEYSKFTLLAESVASEWADSFTIVHCKYEVSPYPGVTFDRQGTGSYFRTAAFGQGSNPRVAGALLNKTIRFAFKVDLPNRYMWRYVCNASDSDTQTGQGAIPTNMNISLITENVLIGCYQDVNGTKGRFFKGVINNVYIFDSLLTDEKINAYLSNGTV